MPMSMSPPATSWAAVYGGKGQQQGIRKGEAAEQYMSDHRRGQGRELEGEAQKQIEGQKRGEVAAPGSVLDRGDGGGGGERGHRER